MKFTETDQTQVSEIRPSVAVSLSQLGYSGYVFRQDESRPYKPFANEREDQRTIAQVECSFSKYDVTRQQWLRELLSNFNGPTVVTVGSIRKSN